MSKLWETEYITGELTLYSHKKSLVGLSDDTLALYH